MSNKGCQLHTNHFLEFPARDLYFWQENDGRWFGTIDNSCGMSAAQLSATAKRSASPEVVDWVRLYIPLNFAPTFPVQLVYCF